MDERQLRHFVTRTVGAMTAQDLQIRAMLIALVGSGVRADAVRRALDGLRAPALTPEIGQAYGASMVTFRAELDRLATGQDAPPAG